LPANVDKTNYILKQLTYFNIGLWFYPKFQLFFLTELKVSCVLFTELKQLNKLIFNLHNLIKSVDNITRGFMFAKMNSAVWLSTLVFLIIVSFSACNKSVKPQLSGTTDSEFYFPGEFEPHESVWMGWPVYENKAGWSVKDLHVQLWATMTPYVYVDVAVNPDNAKKGWKYENQMAEIRLLMKKYNVPEDKVRFHIIKHEDVWWRDMGPIFLVNKKGERAAVNFGFNGWGYEANKSAYSVSESSIDSLVAAYLKVKEIRTTSLISEGGDREFNGKGVLMVVESVEKHRNPNMTKEQMNAEFKRVLGVKKVIWLPYGRYDDDLTFKGLLPTADGKNNIYTAITTGGHIDEHVRFVSATKILYTEISPEDAKKDPIASENKRRFDANLKVLRSETDQDGNKFELIEMPSAPAIFETLKPGDGVYDYLAANDSMKLNNPIPAGKPIKVVLASSYLNFLVTNGVVLAQKFWKEGSPDEWKKLDQQAFKILQSVFPDRKIVGFDPRAINIGGGGIHCNSQQMPKIVK